MTPKYIVIIWHLAGDRNNQTVFYTWNDPDTDSAFVFYSKIAAKNRWKESGMSDIHAATIVEVTAEKRTWI